MADQGRRDFIRRIGAAGLGLATVSGAALAQRRERRPQPRAELLPLTANEYLMAEHGAIGRLMMVYDECADRLEAGVDVPAGVLLNAGAVVSEFVEAYHEELEEQLIFEPFLKADRMTRLVQVLGKQHGVGQRLAARAIFHAGKGDLLAEGTRGPLIEICRGYARMYRAHAAHEDTVLFAGLREIMTVRQFYDVAQQFEEFEVEKLGEGGFAAFLARLAQIEGELGIADLDQFTVQV